MSAVSLQPSQHVVDTVAALMRTHPVAWAPVHGGYTQAGRWIVRFQDDSTAFAKVGTTEQTAGWLREEYVIYSAITASFMPELLGWDGGEVPILVLEDLSAARWPPPWSRETVDRVMHTLAEVACTRPPQGLPELESLRAALSGWTVVAAGPRPFLSLRLCSEDWLEIALPELVRAESEAVLAGDRLVHLDVRSDNICFAADRTMLIDWNWACRGNPRADVAAWLPSLHAEGGPPPEELLPDEPEHAALISGYFASNAGLPPPETGPRVREGQLRALRTALPWAARALSLPHPDGPRAASSIEGG